MRRVLTCAVIGACVWGASISAQQPDTPALRIRALSARPDLVTGGDVLVQIDGPARLAPGRVTVRLNGADVSAAFRGTPTHAVVGLVTGLRSEEHTSELQLLAYRMPSSA